ncbi:MAG: hypothetical protein JJV95_05415 [Sulfurospirillum sp.]|nr:hypothetical protein [Sulfurospirillum sp.]
MIWLLMYNFEKKLKSLEYESPYDIIIKEFDVKPSNFYINPTHKKVGLNIIKIPTTVNRFFCHKTREVLK